jgi:hypothetical protein
MFTMNPVLFYPRNTAGANLLQEVAESKDVERIKISKEFWEDVEDMLFAEQMKARRTGKFVPREKLKERIDKLTTPQANDC